jgi:hypothetical protein
VREVRDLGLMWAIEFEEPEGRSRTLKNRSTGSSQDAWLIDRQACARHRCRQRQPRAGWQYQDLAIGDQSRLWPTRRPRGHSARKSAMAGWSGRIG